MRHTIASKFLAVGLVVVLAAAVWILGIAPVLSRYERNREFLRERADILRRWQQKRTDLTSDDNLDGQSASSDYLKQYLQGSSDALIGAQLQTRIRTILDNNKANVQAIQNLPRNATADAEYHGVRVQVSTTVKSLRNILFAIEQNTPFLFVERLSVQRQAGFNQINPGGNISDTVIASIEVTGAKWQATAPKVSAH